MSFKTTKKFIRRRRGACDSCKQRKVRCDGEGPCTACRRSGSYCHYQPSATRSKNAILTRSDTEVAQYLKPLPANLDNDLPTCDPTYDCSNFSSDDSNRSAVYCNSEFPQIFASPPNVECSQSTSLNTWCFQPMRPDADYAGQKTWAYPKDYMKEAYLCQLSDYQHSLIESTEYERYIPTDSLHQKSFTSFIPSAEFFFQDHAVCSNDRIQDLSYSVPVQSSYLYDCFLLWSIVHELWKFLRTKWPSRNLMMQKAKKSRWKHKNGWPIHPKVKVNTNPLWLGGKNLTSPCCSTAQ